MLHDRFRLRAAIVGGNHALANQRRTEAFARRRIRHRRPVPLAVAAVAVAVVLLAGCPSTTPKAPANVAGTYQGDVTLWVEGYPQSRPGGTAVLQVQQSGKTITVSGSLSFAGRQTTVPSTSGSMDDDGQFDVNAGGSRGMVHRNCGTFQPTAAGISFAEGSVGYLEMAKTTSCGTAIISGVLLKR